MDWLIQLCPTHSIYILEVRNATLIGIRIGGVLLAGCSTPTQPAVTGPTQVPVTGATTQAPAQMMASATPAMTMAPTQGMEMGTSTPEMSMATSTSSMPMETSTPEMTAMPSETAMGATQPAAGGGASGGYTVLVGAEDPEQGVDIEAFFPATLHVHVGDTVTWTQNSNEIHTVTFLAGKQTPEVFNPDARCGPGGDDVQPAGSLPGCTAERPV